MAIELSRTGRTPLEAMGYRLHREGRSESRGLTIRSSRNRFVAPELSWGFKGGFGLTQVLDNMRFVLVFMFFLLLAACDSEHDISPVASSPSPNGSTTAVAYTDSGGGGAGWCYVCTDVVHGALNSETARCTHSQQWFHCSSHIGLHWLSPESLLASYSGQPATTPVPESEPAPSTPSVAMRYRKSK
jgi:hypothetical protein